MNNKLRILPFILFLFVFGIYLYNMCPSISAGDSGEFCAASIILGIPHSPGYPLFCLLGKIFSISFPFASLAYRINLVSAVFGALAVLIMFLLVQEATRNTIAALVSSLSFALYRAFWTTSIQSEVFALNSFFVVIILFFVYLSLSDVKYLSMSIFLLGLGAGNHQTVIATVPVILFSLWKNRNLLSFNKLAAFCLLFVLGFSVYVYLPVRSLKNPALDWSNPENLDNVIRVITRKDYGTFQLTVGKKEALDFAMLIKQVSRYISTLKQHATIYGVIIGLLGWLIFFRKEPNFGTGNFIVFLGSGIGLILLANLPFDDMSEGIFERFYILPAIPFCIACGYAADILTYRSKIVGLLFIPLTIVMFLNSKDYCNWRNYYLEYDYGKNILRTLEKNSIFFMDGGDDTFYSTAYLCFAERKRPDVELHDRGGLVFKNIYGNDFRSLQKDQKELRRQQIETKFLKTRPLYYSTFNKNILPGASLYPGGILFKAGSSPADSRALYPLLRSAYSDFPDYRSRALAPVYVFMHSFTLDKPLTWWNYAFKKWKGVDWLASNIKSELHKLAFECFQKDMLVQAEFYYYKILELDSKDVSALVNMGVVEEKKKNIPRAKSLYEQVISLAPGYADAYYNLGSLYWKEENWQKVVECFSKVLEINPGHANAARYLPAAQQRLRNRN